VPEAAVVHRDDGPCAEELAVERGELPVDEDPGDVAFQLNALAAATSYGFQRSCDPTVFDRARCAMHRVLLCDG
jgi:hypothetical protein